jgi:endonuclease YncB( thermonuclease family)
MPAPWEFSWDIRRPAGIAAFFAALLLAFPPPAPRLVTDGDTLCIDGRPHRIANIDAPELRHAQCDAERRLAMVAKRRLIELLGSGRMEVTVGDPVTGRTFDRHDRILATISVDGHDVGAILIAEGLARPWEGKRRSWCAAE